MLTEVPVIDGVIECVQIRTSGASFNLERILNLVRTEAGILPYTLKNSPSLALLQRYRDVVVYLGHYYAELSSSTLAETFKLPFEYVQRLCANPLSACDLPILTRLQSLIEPQLLQSVAWNTVENRPLYSDELAFITQADTTIYSAEHERRLKDFASEVNAGLERQGNMSLAECDTFSVSCLLASPEETENTEALIGLRQFYAKRGEPFDPQQFWGEDVDFSLWNQCKYTN